MKTKTYEWNHMHTKDDMKISITPDYLEQLYVDNIDVLKATNILEEHGIRVKTECGNCPLVDVLVDIGKAIRLGE